MHLVTQSHFHADLHTLAMHAHVNLPIHVYMLSVHGLYCIVNCILFQ